MGRLPRIIWCAAVAVSSVAIAGSQSTDRLAAIPVQTANGAGCRGERGATARIRIVKNIAHPEFPPTLLYESNRPTCDPGGPLPAGAGSFHGALGPPAVRAGDRLRMMESLDGSTGILTVVALEDGDVGATIRCSSPFGETSLLGRIIDKSTVRMAEESRKSAW